MNILDLKKGDKVYGLLEWNSSSVPIGVKYAEAMRVRKMTLTNNGWDIILNYRDEAIIRAQSLADGKIYASLDDCLNQENAYTLKESIFEILGCTLHQITNEPFVWKWNEAKKAAESYILRYYQIDLFNPKLPDGYYATKEECEKANRKTIKVAIYRKDTRIVEVDADTFDEAQDWVDAHIEDIFDDGEEMDYMVEEVTD